MSERLIIVGPGRMGLAMGLALHRAGAIDGLTYFGRHLEAPPHPIFDPDGGGADYRLLPHPVAEGTTVVLLAVPDSALGTVAQELARSGTAPAGCVALHLAGALSTDVLAPLHAAGYAVGSLHPLQSVADPWAAAERLEGIAFAVAGEPAAAAAARRLVLALRGRPLVIPPTLRPLYHAAAVAASNFLVTLATFAAGLLQEAGVPAEDALPALLPLMRGTLENLEQLGPSAALTGPIARGDVDTVRLHLARLSPSMRRLYSSLGRETLRLARAAGLDPDRAARLESLLRDR